MASVFLDAFMPETPEQSQNIPGPLLLDAVAKRKKGPRYASADLPAERTSEIIFYCSSISVTSKMSSAEVPA